jgi:hypothetical protein
MFPFTQEKVIKKFISVHGNKYDYSIVEYVNSYKKVKIICPTHGVFEQSPNHHSKGVGCPKCSGYYKTNNEIIKEFTSVHGNKYDYTKVEYVNAKTKVTIICPVHGNFERTPNHHLGGSGCPKCRKKRKIYNNFIPKANLLYSNKYDYTKVEYVDVKTKVTIICPVHGNFERTPTCHLSGQGCPECRKNPIAKSVEQYTIDNVLIRTFKSIYAAGKFIGKNSTSISLCCSGKTKHAHGFIWKYAAT